MTSPQEMLEDIQSSSTAQNGIRLTAWEETLVDSITHQLEEGRDLTDKQLAVLERIWDRA